MPPEGKPPNIFGKYLSSPSRVTKKPSKKYLIWSSPEREVWENKARKDKARYEVEKAMYKGPWKIPANRRTPKDPTAPKRPMSAFLAFSNKRRAALKREHPDASNADLSKMLSKTWREADDDLRKKYMDEEADLRAKYKVEMAAWRKRVAEEKKVERQEREKIAMETAEARQNDPMSVPMVPQGGGQFPGNQAGPGMGNQGQPAAPDMIQGAGFPAASTQMYMNPYSMQTGAGGQFGDFSGLGMQGAQYANLMAGNPFAAQQFMGTANAASTQQQLLSQLFGRPMQGNLGMYPGMQGQGGQAPSMQDVQGMQRGQGMNPGGFGNNPAFAPYGMSGGMDNLAAQRAMLQAQMGGGYGGQMHGGMGGAPGDMMGQLAQQQDRKDDDQQQHGNSQVNIWNEDL